MHRTKKIGKLAAGILAAVLLLLPLQAYAASGTHTVAWGDTMWKIAVRYQIGVSELIQANPQIKNPNLIYPGQTLNIPNIDDVKTLEQQVIDLVNQQRSWNGLPALKANWEVSRVARYKSQDMINNHYFDHQSPTYGSPFNMMENFGNPLFGRGRKYRLRAADPAGGYERLDEFSGPSEQHPQPDLQPDRRRRREGRQRHLILDADVYQIPLTAFRPPDERAADSRIKPKKALSRQRISAG